MTIAHYPQSPGLAPLRGKRVCLWIIAVILLGACSGGGSVRPRERDYGEPGAQSARSNDVLIRAIGLVGTPYRYGGNTPEGGFDCSGLVDFVFLDAAGLRLPRSTHELIELDAPSISRKHLRPGDLLFFNPGGGPASHIGIYVGESRFVHAPKTGGTVRLESLDSEYWARYYTGAKRILR
jgi:cell wall-associated NlpC family hydrolase